MSSRLITLLTALGLLAASGASAQTTLLHPAEDNAAAGTQVQTSPAFPKVARQWVSLDAVSINRMRAGDEAVLVTPSGTAHSLVYDRTEAGYGGGRVWIGHVRGFGHDYPVLISTYEGRVNGSIATPGGQLRLEGTEQRSLLTDLEAAGEHVFAPSADDSLIPSAVGDRTAAPAAAADLSAAPASATPGSPARIDLLLLFNTDLQNNLGGYAATIARLNLLVATANNAYANSGIYVSLNLVYAQAVGYSYAATGVSDGTALSSLRTDPAVAALRNQYGADVVVMVRPFVASVCGLGYLVQNSDYAFAVVEDGSSGIYYCHVTTLTHEVGHVMGAAHDVGTSVNLGDNPNSGLPSYNRGYCNGGAGTIMSYTSTSGCYPLAPYFSNPSLGTCNSGPCGVPIGTPYTVGTTTVTGADSTTAINANAPFMATWRAAPTKFTPLVPSRLLDTRAGMTTVDGLYAGGGALGLNGQLDLAVAGRGGVPANGAGAVVMNVTVANPASWGYLTAWPTGAARPLASNINFVTGQTIPNLVVAKLGSAGKVSLYNASTSADLLVDVAGWFPSSSAFVPLTPARLLDTRAGGTTVDGSFSGVGALAAGGSLNLTVAGRAGVPAAGADTVVLNVAATQPTAAGYVTAWPAGSARPATSNLNFAPGQTIANLVVTKIGTNGQVALYNAGGSTQLVADVAGWFPAGSELTSLVPARLLDTRPGAATIDGQFAGGGAMGLNAELDLTVAGRAGIPGTGVGAVVLNVTAVSPSSPGYLVVWPAGSTRPLASNLNFLTGDVVPNLVFAKVGTNGQVAIYNSAQSTHVLADVVAWFAAP